MENKAERVKWHSCINEMPEEGYSVIIYTEFHEYNIAYWRYNGQKRPVWHLDIDTNQFLFTENILGWTPIPMFDLMLISDKNDENEENDNKKGSLCELSMIPK